ncbi:MAG TPA: hypothetical protein VK982_16610, partial [Bacteroidales bacterium]|nr:hypothetical protein [Bacteroidales bacterium]
FINTEKIKSTITEATKITNSEVNIVRITSSSEMTSQMPKIEIIVINKIKVIRMYEVTFFNPCITNVI